MNIPALIGAFLLAMLSFAAQADDKERSRDMPTPQENTAQPVSGNEPSSLADLVNSGDVCDTGNN